MLRIRTTRKMIELNDEEAAELRERLRRFPAAQSAEETIAVASNASTSVTFTDVQKTAVLEILEHWLEDVGEQKMGSGPFRLRNTLTEDCEQ